MERRVLGRYELTERLGRGGMGEVWRARDPVLRRDVAIKVLRRGERESQETLRDEFVRRFMREARAAASLKHPNVVAIHDVGVDTEPYIVMEYVEGTTLRSFVGKNDVPIATRLGWLVEIASALAAAHDMGLVHRDIKPDNVMITKDGHAKVLDFGIAKAIGDEDAPPASAAEAPASFRTQQGRVVGTPKYMAPEQLSGEKIDARVDQWAWACVAYELLLGSMPDRDEAALPVSLTLPDVPFDVAAAIVRARSADPERRFASMHALLKAISAETTSERAPLAVESAKRNPDAPTTTGPARRPRTGRVALVALGSFAFAALAVFAVARSRHTHAAEGPVDAGPACSFARLEPFALDGTVISVQGEAMPGSILLSMVKFHEDAAVSRSPQLVTVSAEGVEAREPPSGIGSGGSGPSWTFAVSSPDGARYYVAYDQAAHGYFFLGRMVANDRAVEARRLERVDRSGADFSPSYVVGVNAPFSAPPKPAFISAGYDRVAGRAHGAVRIYGEHLDGVALYRTQDLAPPQGLVAVADDRRVAFAFASAGKLYAGSFGMTASIEHLAAPQSWSFDEVDVTLKDAFEPIELGESVAGAAIALDGDDLHVVWPSRGRLYHAILHGTGDAGPTRTDATLDATTDDTVPSLLVEHGTVMLAWRDSAHIFYGQGPDVATAVRRAGELGETNMSSRPWIAQATHGALVAWLGGSPLEVRRAMVTCK